MQQVDSITGLRLTTAAKGAPLTLRLCHWQKTLKALKKGAPVGPLLDRPGKRCKLGDFGPKGIDDGHGLSHILRKRCAHTQAV